MTGGSQRSAFITPPHYRLLARCAAALALLTILTGPGSPMLGWVGVAQAH